MRIARLSVLLLTLFSLLPTAPSDAHGVVSARAADDCEGTACVQVAVTFDEAKGQYRVQNNSADARVRVTASNRAASAEVCVAPGKSEHLSLKSIVGAYRADYDASCGGGSGT